ncbi:MAG: hypothetical protein J1E39_06670 [Eubacterium sp.]|nr:hypothetical protein [Eubacterium sp.]
MKSYINSLVDFKTFEFEREVKLSCPEEYIEKQLKRITRANKTTEDVTVLEKGDVAVIGLESSLERYNRPQLTLAVGSGLFDKELEAQLVGKNVGETFTVTVKETAVKVNVISGKRTVFPAPTDEAVKKYAETAEDLEGIETVAQFREHVKQQYFDEQQQKTVFGTLNDMVEYVLTNSDWEFDETELEEMYNNMLADMEQMAQEIYGKTFAELTDDEIAAETSMPTKEALLAELHNQSEWQIASLLFVITNHGMDPAKVDIEQAYELDWAFVQDYVEENITFTVD